MTDLTDSDARARPRVVLVSDRHLIGDTARTALISRELEVIVERAPSGLEQLADLAHVVQRFRPDVGLLLLTDLDDPARRRAGASVVAQIPLRWVLLTATTTEAAQGAVVAAGAVGVLPMSVSVDALVEVLEDVRAGRPVMSVAARHRAIRAWRTLANEQRRLVTQMAALTPREMAVLGLLYGGLTVRVIAEREGVTEGTVRCQVKAILRKLRVRSQLAAVAAYRQVCGQVPESRIGR